MKRLFIPVFLLIAMSGKLHAQTMVYLCVDEHGRKTYQNIGDTKGCKKIDLPKITTISGPAKKAAKQVGPVKSSVTPPAFPKVDNEMQKVRDNDRQQILLDELKTEEGKLANLKKEFNNGEPERQGDERNYAKYQERVLQMTDSLNRAEKNISALKREISNLK
jgi:hypothetical protein